MVVWHLLVFGCPGFFVGVHYRNITAFSFVIKVVTVENDKGQNPMNQSKLKSKRACSWYG